jgi:hypothetical protein
MHVSGLHNDVEVCINEDWENEALLELTAESKIEARISKGGSWRLLEYKF